MDPIRRAFLKTQYEEGNALADSSDVLTLHALRQNEEPPQSYVARFNHCGLIRTGPGLVERAASCEFGIYFSDEYQLQQPGVELITVLKPTGLLHSNVRYPFVCLGRVRPGTPLVELLFSLYRLVTYRLWNTNDALDPVAAEWLRLHQAELPLDTPPLKRRKAPLAMRVTVKERP